MAYLSVTQLQTMGFKKLGKDVKISDKACIYNAELIEVGDCSRIDDLCVLSGNITIGSYNHITPMCLVAGGVPGIVLEDFCTLAYGVKVFSQSDDYTGETLANSLVPRKFKNEKFAPVLLKKHVIVGANSVIFPGVTVEEGCSIGAMTLVTKSTSPWGIYVGSPAKRMKDRSNKLLELEKQFLSERNS
ncbi:acyltransferase [Pseudomonas sp. FSL W5-0299]|uniref:acyltransferase n=1 Tax=Pseudomonas sp. FSL W5-0299 TaxID=1917484 RepID=UPI00098AFEE6|nr:acyltransferase [Pseudomonas sp. FSL W5-0299]